MSIHERLRRSQVCCTLRLHNAGGGSLHGLRIAVGQPCLHMGASVAELGADPLQLLSGELFTSSPLGSRSQAGFGNAAAVLFR